jgi:hypothetical protein
MRGPLVIHFASALFGDGSHRRRGPDSGRFTTGRLALGGGQKKRVGVGEIPPGIDWSRRGLRVVLRRPGDGAVRVTEYCPLLA